MATEAYLISNYTGSGKYILCSAIRFPYAVYNDSIYSADSAPSGAFFITGNEKTKLQNGVSAGGTLCHYSNQRPYIKSSWQQPTMTSNSSNGITTSASSNNEVAHSPLGSSAASWYSDDSFSDWWKITFPYYIYATKIEVRSREKFYYDNDWPTCGQWYKDSAYNYPIGDEMSVYDANQIFTIYNSSTPVELNQLVFKKYYPSGTYAGISQMKITAQYISYEVADRNNSTTYASYFSIIRKV